MVVTDHDHLLIYLNRRLQNLGCVPSAKAKGENASGMSTCERLDVTSECRRQELNLGSSHDLVIDTSATRYHCATAARTDVLDGTFDEARKSCCI